MFDIGEWNSVIQGLTQARIISYSMMERKNWNTINVILGFLFEQIFFHHILSSFSFQIYQNWGDTYNCCDL